MYVVSNVVVCTSRKAYAPNLPSPPPHSLPSNPSNLSNPYPTYETTETDKNYGTLLRRTTRLTDGDRIIDDEQSTYDDRNRLRSTTYLDGTFVTNAYSCCRLLWTQDRQRRRTLRSATTGTDHLYHAMEDVWLADISSNGEYRYVVTESDDCGTVTNSVTTYDLLGRPVSISMPLSDVLNIYDGRSSRLLAEIELPTESTQFSPPPWLGPEVTHDHRYKNNNLARHPYSEWA